jgi:hypothetical protein
MNVEIGAEAAQFPEKEYINGIAFAVYAQLRNPTRTEHDCEVITEMLSELLNTIQYKVR